ncbi:MAG: glycosyltransferase [Planctomycetia bacterium]|nr:glycosyltransferase [Planctomycetia bacterium]
MNRTPTFSAVIATYDRRGLLLQAVRSVVEQSFPADEIIVVFDGSPREMVETMSREFPQVTCVVQPNLGRSIAKNTGAFTASGDWICFLDDDDLWHRDKLLRTRDYIVNHPDCQALRNPVWYFAENEDGPTSGFGFRRDFVAKDLDECHEKAFQLGTSANDFSYLDIEGESFLRMVSRNHGIMSSTVIRRELLFRVGAFQPFNDHADDWMMFTNAARAVEWHLLPEFLGFTRLHHGQATATTPDGAIHILSMLVDFWCGGRPLPYAAPQQEIRSLLMAAGPRYRLEVQGYLWRSLFARRFRDAAKIHLLGSLLLPRFRDRFYARMPPQLTWRFERYILGRHK